MAHSASYPRDLTGYGSRPIDPEWPRGAKLAIQIVVNYEEGGENSVLHGDAGSEAMLTEDPSTPFPGARNMGVESQYEYGSRAGFWRLHHMLTKRNLPVTVFGVTTALAKNPQAVDAMKSANWEIASHGLKWIDYTRMSEAEERIQIEKSIRLHEEVVGKPPRGLVHGSNE